MPAPGLHPSQGAAGNGRRLPDREGGQGLRHKRGGLERRFPDHPGSASAGSSTSSTKASRGCFASARLRPLPGRGPCRPAESCGSRGRTVGVTELAAPAVLLAAGSVPRTIPGFEVDERFVLTSDEVLDLERLPESAAVIGGGAIGCEFASMLADMGVRVTILEALPSILPGVDPTSRRWCSSPLPGGGIGVRTGVMVKSHAPAPDGRSTAVQFAVGGDAGADGGESVEVRQWWCRSAGAPTVTGCSAPGCGVEVDSRGFVKVDELMRRATKVSGRWATWWPRPGWPTSASPKPWWWSTSCSAARPVPVDYANVPWCVYTFPEVAFAGYSEEAARRSRL